MNRTKEIIFLVISWCICLILIEVICGFIAQNTYMQLELIDSESSDTSYGYFKPNQDRVILFPGLEPYHITTNSLGLRSVDKKLTYDSIKNSIRILTVGDSATMGLFVDDEASYPYQLQKVIDQKNVNAVVLNAGVGGTTISDFTYYIKNKGIELAPDKIIINFCTNDLSDLKNEVPFYEKAQIEAEKESGDWIKRLNIVRVFRRLYVFYKYQRWLKKIDDPKGREILKNQDRSLDDVFYITKTYHGNDVLNNPLKPELSEQWNEYFRHFQDLIMFAKERNIQIYFFIHPEPLAVYDRLNPNYESILTDFMEKNKVPYLVVSDVFKKHKDQLIDLYNNPPRDFHLGKKGNAILAEQLYKLIFSN